MCVRKSNKIWIIFSHMKPGAILIPGVLSSSEHLELPCVPPPLRALTSPASLVVNKGLENRVLMNLFICVHFLGRAL